jgi:hypothetical protein
MERITKTGVRNARATGKRRNAHMHARTHAMLDDSVTITWRVLGLQMEERPPAMESGCEYNE